MTLAFFPEVSSPVRRAESAGMQQAAVANLGQAALSGASMDSLFYLTCAFVTDLLGVEHCDVVESHEVHLSAHVAYALDLSAPVIIDDLARETRFVPSPALLARGVVSGIVVPIMTGYAADAGALVVWTTSRVQFATSDVDFTRALAGILGQAIVRGRADHELRRRARQQSAISELTRLAMRSMDEATLGRARTIVIECLDVADAAFVEDRQSCLSSDVEDRQSCLSSDVTGRIACPPHDARAPVASPTAHYGVLLAHTARRFTAAEQELLQALANILAEGFDRERAARELAASEQRYREVVEGASEVIFEMTMDGKFKSINAAFESVTGWPAEQFVGKPYLDLVHPDERLHSREVFRAVIERQESASDTLTIVGRDRIAQIELTSFPKVENGRTTAIYGFARDVTEARRAERERQQLTRNLQLLLASTIDGILTFDLDSRCTMVNQAAMQILGANAEEIVRASIGDVLRAVAAGGEVRYATLKLQRADGSLVPVEYSATPVLDGTETVGVVVSFTDISERLKLEAKLEQADRLTRLGRLAAIVAHEFNNVLMGVAPYVEMIRRGKHIPTAVEQITQSVRRGKRITGDILRFTQPAEPVRTAFDVEPWLENLFIEARTLLPPEYDVTSAVAERGLHIDGDRHQLQQVFTNLVLNARDAMIRRGTLTIAARREAAGARFPFGKVEHPERYVHLLVSDTGCGMTPETLLHAFEPLFTTKRDGTGLGLAVVHQVVQRHEGEIFIESTRGRGTTFHIFLPLATRDNVRTLPVPAEPVVSRTNASRILLVEDDETVGDGLTVLLALDAIEVAVAKSGEAAIRAVRNESFDLVILDVGLPDIDGTRVYDAIARLRPELPVIFSTGHADASKVEALLTRPSVAFLHKPYEGATLLSTIRRVMSA